MKKRGSKRKGERQEDRLEGRGERSFVHSHLYQNHTIQSGLIVLPRETFQNELLTSMLPKD